MHEISICFYLNIGKRNDMFVSRIESFDFLLSTAFYWIGERMKTSI